MTFEVRDFVNLMIDTAEDLATAECGKPEDETLGRLESLGATLQAQLAPLVGHDLADRIIEGLNQTVMGLKHEREALMAMDLI